MAVPRIAKRNYVALHSANGQARPLLPCAVKQQAGRYTAGQFGYIVSSLFNSTEQNLAHRKQLQMSTKPTIAEQANPNFVGDPPYTGAWKGCAYDPELPGPIFTAGKEIRNLSP
eukprot:6202613-Pleurochrysis_carterae.AAC.4